MEVDVAGLQRALTSSETAVCDLCGQPGLVSAAVPLAGAPEVAEPVEYLRVCRECRERLAQGDLPVDAEIAAGLPSGEE
ncbi:MAG: hypothetical protein KC442_10070 [Thermomicrobiales bacterium]|nr:hypothetical protein [Thermomicrobiales bacterium]